MSTCRQLDLLASMACGVENDSEQINAGMYTVVDILSYAGCTNVDVALNYSMLAVTTVVSQLVTNHLGAPFLLAPLITAGLLVFQVLLCVGVGCSGISVVWSAQAGYILVCYVAASNAPPNRLLRTAVAASSLLSLALGLYYFLTAEIITTVAHGCAAVLGSAVAAVAVYFLAPVPRPSPGYQTLADGPLSTPALEVKDSWIAGAGQGLFAAEAIPKGTVLCFYTGSTLGTKEAMRYDAIMSRSCHLAATASYPADPLPCPLRWQVA